MDSRLFYELEKKIGEWLDDNVETPEYEHLSIWWPEEGVNKMTSAAALIFDAIVESQHFAKEQE